MKIGESDMPSYSDQDLLRFAYGMLVQAREEQQRSRRKDKWLTNNETFDAIETRAEELRRDLLEARP